MKKGKFLIDAYKKINDKSFNIDEAVQFFVDSKRDKFDETIEISMNLGVDPRHADQMVRGVISLPHGTGKKMRVAVFARDEKAEEAKLAGADIVGAEDLAEDMQKGNLDYDRIIATPDLMGVVGRIGKVLGPKGLMPNPKVGTVCAPDQVAATVKALKGGRIDFRVEKAGIVHAPVGRRSMGVEALSENLLAFASELRRLKPAAAKGVYMKSVAVSSTMSVSVRIDANELLREAQD